MDRETLRAYRYWKGMTQAQFAKWIGVSTPVIALFESGNRHLSELTRAKLAHKVDITDPEFIAYTKRRNNLKESV